MANNGQAIQRSEGTIKEILERRKGEIAAALPKHLNVERLLRVAYTAINKVPKLQSCTGSSLLTAIMQSAELGLEPGGALGHAYLVPFKEICQLIVGYRGYIELCWRSGELSQIECHVIREEDEFVVEYGLNPRFFHKPKLVGDAGKPVLVYMLAGLKNGAKQFELMTVDQVEKVRARSRSANDGPWVTDWEEMAKKTVLRRGIKYLPLSSEKNQALARAMEIDDEDFVEGEVAGRTLALAENVQMSAPTKTAELKKKLTAPKHQPIIDVAPGQTEEEAIAVHASPAPSTEPAAVAAPAVEAEKDGADNDELELEAAFADPKTPNGRLVKMIGALPEGDRKAYWRQQFNSRGAAPKGEAP